MSSGSADSPSYRQGPKRGHEEQFLPPRTSARCGFRKETFGETRWNGRDAYRSRPSPRNQMPISIFRPGEGRLMTNDIASPRVLRRATRCLSLSDRATSKKRDPASARRLDVDEMPAQSLLVML